MDNGCILERTGTKRLICTSSLFQKVSRVSNTPKTWGGVACLCHVSGEPTSSRRWDVYLLLFVYYCYYSLQQAAP